VWKPRSCWRPHSPRSKSDNETSLIAFALAGRDTSEHRKNVHVCGEAYSGFQGFIEGALATAEEVVAAICKNYDELHPRNEGPSALFLTEIETLKASAAGAEARWHEAVVFNVDSKVAGQTDQMCENCGLVVEEETDLQLHPCLADNLSDE
jgi:hypothetical protein